MLPKCVETIDRLPHEGKDIVRSSGKLETRVHHRNGYRLGYTAKFAASNRGSGHHNRCSHVRWSEELVLMTSGLAKTHKGRRCSRIVGLGTSPALFGVQ